MIKVTYKNTMPYEVDYTRRSSKYRPFGQESYKNKGETIESIVKFHRGIYSEVNPNTSYDKGSDIEEEMASVKSSEGSLGRSIGGRNNTGAQKIVCYFKTVHSKVFIWVEWNEETETVTEYQMNKREFGEFVRLFTRICNNSEHTEKAVRFRKTNRKMIEWLESKAG